MSIDKLKTVYSTGAFVNNVKTFFKKINEIIDHLNNNPTVDLGYTSYIATLNQSGTNAPVATNVLKNEFTESPTFYYDNTGLFRIASSDFGTLTDSKVFVNCGGANQNNSAKTLDCYLAAAPLTRETFFDQAEVALETVNGAILTDGLIFNTQIEIRVYN